MLAKGQVLGKMVRSNNEQITISRAVEMKNWYAVQCKPNQDARAEEHLCNQQYEVYRPLARVRKRCQGQIRHAIESLFPRYLFVHLDDFMEDWGPIRSTRGVAQMVRFAGWPAVVPDDVIQQLHCHTDDHNCVDMTAAHYRPNQRVRVVEGPFSGYEGLFTSKKGEDRVIILLNIMHRAQQLVMPERAIEPA